MPSCDGRNPCGYALCFCLTHNLRSLLSLPPEEQTAALDEKLEGHTSAALAAASGGSSNAEKSIGLLRLVAYFNPKLFVDIRRRAAEHCEKLQLQSYRPKGSSSRDHLHVGAAVERQADVQRIARGRLCCPEVVQTDGHYADCLGPSGEDYLSGPSEEDCWSGPSGEGSGSGSGAHQRLRSRATASKGGTCTVSSPSWAE